MELFNDFNCQLHIEYSFLLLVKRYLDGYDLCGKIYFWDLMVILVYQPPFYTNKRQTT